MGSSNDGTPTTTASSSSSFSHKRTIDQMSGNIDQQPQQRQSQMKMKRSIHDISDSDMNDSIDNMTSDDIFLPASMQPQVTISESPRFDAANVKREGSDVGNISGISRPQSPGSVYRNSYRKFFFFSINATVIHV